MDKVEFASGMLINLFSTIEEGEYDDHWFSHGIANWDYTTFQMEFMEYSGAGQWIR